MNTFSKTARLLHWLMAPLLIIMLCIGVAMVASISLRPVLIAWHRPLGMAIWLLAIVRLGYRLRHPPPPLPQALPRWQATAARSAGGYPVVLMPGLSLPPIMPHHPALYAWLHLAHVVLAWALSGLILLHMTGALQHLWIRKDGVFSAMIWPGKNPN